MMKRILCVIAWAFSGMLWGQTGVYTKAFDNARSGTNQNETILTQASVTAKGLVRQPTIPVIGDARGMEAQPLILPQVKVADGSVHDVLVLPSMANVVRGVDAETGAGLWQVNLGTPVTSSGRIDSHQINQHWGCLSTGIIDPDTQRFYQVCGVSTDNSGTPESGRYFMFVLNVKDGSQVVPQVPVQGTDTRMWKQRSSLVMTNIGGTKTIFFAHGSIFETASGFTGGITAFDVATNKVVTTLPLSSGIWMAGQGLAADDSGHLYAITGNGDFDPGKGFHGESFIKVQYTPSSSTLQVVDLWSPWTDLQRTGGAPKPAAKLAGESSSSEGVKPVGGGMSMAIKDARVVGQINAQGQAVALVYPSMATGAWSDEDWGSAGPACLFAINVCIAAGKDGIGYPIRTTNLGGTTLKTAGTAANYAKLAAPCAWITLDPGPVSCAPADPRTLNFLPRGDTAHLHMTPVQMFDPLLKSWVIFVWGENGQLHKWAVGPTGKLTYVAQSHEYASADVRGNSPGGMPGGFCSGSSNKGAEDSAILVCSIPYGDANAQVVNGRLLVYDPFHLAADGSLKVLWDSQRWGVAYIYNKFMTPTVWNGRIYLPNYDGGVEVFGLGQ
jgi:hypothetical protein